MSYEYRFPSAADALKFAFLYQHVDYASPAIFKLCGVRIIGGGAGLTGTAAQDLASTILSKLRRLNQQQRCLLTIKYAPRDDARYASALIALLPVSELIGARKLNDDLRKMLFLKYFGYAVQLKSLARDHEISDDSVMRYNACMHTILKPIDDLAHHIITGILTRDGIVDVSLHERAA